MEKQNLLPQIFEPLAITMLLALFIIPTLTVINLSPITQELKKPDVLGVTDHTSNIVIEKVGGIHDIFKEEGLQKQGEEYIYTTNIEKREGGKIYSKPIMVVENKGRSNSTVSFYGYTDSSIKSSLSIKIDKKNYSLVDNNKVELKPGEKKTIYLFSQNENSILFKENLSIVIYF